MEVLLERDQDSPQERVIDAYERRYNDTTTLAAEMLDGSMQSSFEYTFDGQELYAQDGSSMGDVFRDSLKDAYHIAREDPRLTCEIRRRSLEMDEYNDMIEMAKGHGPNTMIVTSDTPWELQEWGEDVGGYNFKRNQTMLRVISRLPNGKIRVTSQTLDGSDRSGLESIHEFFGSDPKSGELLGQRVKTETDPGREDLITNEATRIYDQKLEQKYGGRFYAGRTPADMENTYQFVKQQEDLIDVFMSDTNDKNLFGLVAALENRWNSRKADRGTAAESFINIRATLPPHMEIQYMAQKAMQQGKSYSGCGVTMTGLGEASGELNSLGYGNKNGEAKDQSYSFNKKMHCVVCQPKAKDDEPQKMCGPCGICKGCDSKLQSTGKT